MSPSTLDVLAQRLRNERLVASPFRSAAEAVAWFGALQSQDYTGAKWGVGQRCLGVTDAALDRAFDQGTIVRTHVLRSTWHFVAPADIRFLLALTAPRIRAAMAWHDRRLELDRTTLRRSAAALEKALRGGQSLSACGTCRGSRPKRNHRFRSEARPTDDERRARRPAV